jgi:hypothetical protein
MSKACLVEANEISRKLSLIDKIRILIGHTHGINKQPFVCYIGRQQNHSSDKQSPVRTLGVGDSSEPWQKGGNRVEDPNLPGPRVTVGSPQTEESGAENGYENGGRPVVVVRICFGVEFKVDFMVLV